MQRPGHDGCSLKRSMISHKISASPSVHKEGNTSNETPKLPKHPVPPQMTASQLDCPSSCPAGVTYQGGHQSRAGYARHFVNNCLLHVALDGLQHGTLQGEGNDS